MCVVHNLNDHLVHLQAKVMRQRQERDILPVPIFARRNDLDDYRLEFVSLSIAFQRKNPRRSASRRPSPDLSSRGLRRGLTGPVLARWIHEIEFDGYGPASHS